MPKIKKIKKIEQCTKIFVYRVKLPRSCWEAGVMFFEDSVRHLFGIGLG